MRNLQLLLVDPDADFQSRFKREVEGGGGVEVATCSLGRKAVLLTRFIHFDAVFANVAAELPYEEVSANLHRQVRGAHFYIYGAGAVPRGVFQPLTADQTIATAKEVVLAYG